MSIQYAGGTIINTTLTQSTGTRAELAQWVRDQLVNAGWTSSGSATDYQLTSATTPQSLAGRVRVYDPGSGSCARLKMSNTTGVKTQSGDLYLIPAVSKVWRIIANKYQFFVFVIGASQAREFACGGIPYLPSFLNGVITECLWGMNNATGDTDTSARTSFRNTLSLGLGSTYANWYGLCNGNTSDFNGGLGTGATAGSPNLVCSVGGSTVNGASKLWHDDSSMVLEPLLAWGIGGINDTSKIRCQLWDSVIITDTFAGDTTITFDGRTYFAITSSNNGPPVGTLFVAVT